MRMIHLTNAQDVGELAMIKSLLDGNRIAYVVHGEHVSSLYPGVPFFVSRAWSTYPIRLVPKSF